MTQMLREMRRSMLDEDEDKENGFGAAAMTDTADVELGGALSRVGRHRPDRQLCSRRSNARSSPAGQDAVIAGGEGERKPVGATELPDADARHRSAMLLTEVTTSAPVSSEFGWRQDPLTGHATFHHGVDIAVAYGQRRQGCGRWHGVVCRRPERLRQHGGHRSRRRPPDAVRSPVAGTRSRRRRRELKDRCSGSPAIPAAAPGRISISRCWSTGGPWIPSAAQNKAMRSNSFLE